MKKQEKISLAAIIIGFSIYYIWYCNSRMVELPHLTWFDQLPLAELLFEGELKISDLFARYCEHGMLGNNILFLFNLCFFNGSTFFDVYINDINVIICGIIIMTYTYITLGEDKNKVIWVIIEGIFLFGSMQGSSGAMETQVRLGILFFLFSMILVDKEFHDDENNLKHLFLTGIVIIASINVFGTLYSFAGIPLIWLISVVNILKKKYAKKSIVISTVYTITIPMYIYQYKLLESNGLSSLGNNSLLNVLQHPVQLIKSLLAWHANGVLGWAYHENADYNESLYLAVGFIVLLIVLISIFLYVFYKMYLITWMPLMCIVYSFGVFAMVYIGRPNGWEWTASEWYTVHIKIAMAASIWIYALLWKRVNKMKILIAFNAILFGILGLAGNIYELIRTPYVKQYYLEKQKYLFVENANDMPVDENGQTPLLHSLEMTMDSIDILKKYRLSVFRYWDGYEAYQEEIGKKVIFLDGRYDDGWVENEVCFIYDTDNSSEIEVNYYSLEKQTVEVWVNGKIESAALELNIGSGCFDIEVEPESKAYVEIKSNYYEQLAEPDNRYVSYIISEVVGQ